MQHVDNNPHFPHKEKATRIKTTTNSDASSQGRGTQHGKYHIGMFQFSSMDSGVYPPLNNLGDYRKIVREAGSYKLIQTAELNNSGQEILSAQ